LLPKLLKKVDSSRNNSGRNSKITAAEQVKTAKLTAAVSATFRPELAFAIRDARRAACREYLEFFATGQQSQFAKCTPVYHNLSGLSS
jgi:hypothetical protein